MVNMVNFVLFFTIVKKPKRGWMGTSWPGSRSEPSSDLGVTGVWGQGGNRRAEAGDRLG